MNYDLLFLEVDKTSKQDQHPISDVDKQTVISACCAGKKVCIASSSNKRLILNALGELQLNQYGNSYTVALNGAHIFDNHTGNTLHTVPLHSQLTYLLFLKAYELDVSCHVYTDNFIYFNFNDCQYEGYKKNGCDCRLVDMGCLDLGLEEAPLKFFVTSPDRDKLECFRREMHDVTKQSLHADFSSDYSLEYTSVYAKKDLIMEFVCGLFGKSASEAVAVKDGDNEITNKYLLIHNEEVFA